MLSLKRDTRADAARTWTEYESRTSRHAAELLAEIQRCDERADLLRASLNDVLAKRGQFDEQRRQLCFGMDRKRSDFEREMERSADPRIDTFIDQLRAENDGLRHRLITREGFGNIDASTGRRRTIASSNGAAIHALALALVRAREQATALKTTYVPDVQAALDSIRADIPTLERLEAETGA